MSRTLSRRALFAGGAAMAAAPRSLGAQPGAWPTQPIRLVVPFAPGGTTDIVARLVAQGLSERLGQPVLVDNRPGAGATIGSAQVAAAAPDGLTILMSNSASHGIGPTLYRSIRYDALRDFAHVALVIASPSVWVAHPAFPARGLQDVIRLSQERPGGLAIASSGSGSSNHLLIARFAELTGARLDHVPYRGAGPAMTDLIAGTVPLMSDSLPSASAHLRQGSVRALGLSAAARHPAFPDVPTFREQGIDLASSSWFGLSAPAGTPGAIVARLHEAVRAVLAEPATAARFAALGGVPGTLGPEGYTAFIRDEIAHWAPVIRASGAQVD